MFKATANMEECYEPICILSLVPIICDESKEDAKLG